MSPPFLLSLRSVDTSVQLYHSKSLALRELYVNRFSDYKGESDEYVV